MCELLVGLPEVNVLGVVDVVDGVLRVHVETRVSRTGCAGCGVIARVKDRPVIELVDLPSFGRPTRLFWHKRRWCCLEESCPAKSWTEVDVRIGAARMALSDRAGRWVTEQVGRHARSVNEVAAELACDWHTVNDTVVAYGNALVDRSRPLRCRYCSRSRRGAHGEGRASAPPGVLHPGRGRRSWPALRRRPWPQGAGPWAGWPTRERTGGPGPLRHLGSVRSLPEGVRPHGPDAIQVADPFHVIKVANTKLDECRRRVQNETLGHRGHKSDPLYRCRRLLTRAEERLDDRGKEKLLGLLRAGDPKGDVATMWQAKEAVRELYTHGDPGLALAVGDPARSRPPRLNPTEARSLGRTLIRWKHQIAAWHRATSAMVPPKPSITSSSG